MYLPLSSLPTIPKDPFLSLLLSQLSLTNSNSASTLLDRSFHYQPQSNQSFWKLSPLWNIKCLNPTRLSSKFHFCQLQDNSLKKNFSSHFHELQTVAPKQFLLKPCLPCQLHTIFSKPSSYRAYNCWSHPTLASNVSTIKLRILPTLLLPCHSPFKRHLPSRLIYKTP